MSRIHYSYLWEKFYSAVSDLAINGNIKDRLSTAYFPLSLLRTDDFPKDLLNDFKEIIDKSTAKGEYYYTEGIKRLTEEEAEEIAKEIVSLFSEIAQRYGKEYT